MVAAMSSLRSDGFVANGGSTRLIPAVCVQLSAQERFGIVVFEAGACGIPVIASRTGGHKETIQDGVNGLHFPSNDRMART